MYMLYCEAACVSSTTVWIFSPQQCGRYIVLLFQTTKKRWTVVMLVVLWTRAHSRWYVAVVGRAARKDICL